MTDLITYKQKQYIRRLNNVIARVHNHEMNELDWVGEHGVCLIAHSVYGYMGKDWNDRMKALAPLAQSHDYVGFEAGMIVLRDEIVQAMAK